MGSPGWLCQGRGKWMGGEERVHAFLIFLLRGPEGSGQSFEHKAIKLYALK